MALYHLADGSEEAYRTVISILGKSHRRFAASLINGEVYFSFGQAEFGERRLGEGTLRQISSRVSFREVEKPI